ncbi:MAG: ABC transporter substrate-binding protein [Sphaerochaeta sp.]|jgi:iron complex transport system substrate-binding protein
MKHTHKKMLFLFIVLVSLAVGLGAAPQTERPAVEQRTIVDMRGREVVLPAAVDKIIALDAGSLRLVSYVDATDKVIAVEDEGHGREITDYEMFALATYRIAYPHLRTLPSIGSANSHEAIIAANPDLVISSAVDREKLDHLQNILGIPVIGVDVDIEFYEMDKFYYQLSMLGEALDREDRAKTLTNGLKALMDDLAARKTQVTTPKRGYAGGMMYYGMADLFRTTGDFIPFDFTEAVNVMPTNPAGNRQPYMTDLESLIAASPDYIFIDAANLNLSREGYRKNKKALDELVPAFTNKDVYVTFVYKYYGTNWDNQLVNVYYVGKVLYPELFADVNIAQKAEEIWTLFFGVPLSFSEVIEQQQAMPAQVDWFN